AQIIYTLNAAGADLLNRAGAAPVDLTRPTPDPNHRTLLLGLKPSRAYTFHVEVTTPGAGPAATCRSDDHTLTTGALAGAPTVTRTATAPAAQAGGFIVTSTGVSGGGQPQAYIIDADGDVVWVAAAPASCSRARMDYEGNNMWMIALNVLNTGGEMRYVSMDGATARDDVSGLAGAHHDFTVRPGGVIATMVWSAGGVDAESDLVERAPDGTLSAVFHVGANLYEGGPSLLGSGSNTYHCNALLYHPADDSYTIGDRNPSLFVKVTRAGRPLWQLGGDCAGAPAPRCAAGGWDSNHGHQLLANGNFLFFSNGAFGGSDPSTVYEYALDDANGANDALTATQVTAYRSAAGARSNSLGDVQRLPNGNTLVVFSNDGLMEEVDSSSRVVQALSAPWFGYADWRATLYGPPER
ncbi:MAG TPA: aryl-sulfate sulfotransferase, partial [Polyangia bacterium]